MTQLAAPLALIILDGWGVSSHTELNAIANARTPYFDALCERYPTTMLSAAGRLIGQEDGAFGNAESGHLCIGTGRPAHDEVTKVEAAIRSGSFVNNEILNNAIRKAAAFGGTIHIIGLLSDAGVHSSTDTMFSVLRIAKNAGAKDVAVHCILDGVDVPTRTADIYVEALEIKLADIGIGRVSTLCGRYFGMDSRGNWERTARVYTMLVHSEGERATDAVKAVRNSFLRGISDEFIAPIIIEESPEVPVARVNDGDLVIYLNHRPETMRQLVRSLSVPDSAGTPKPMIDSVCLVEYDRTFGLPVAFPADGVSSSLTDVLNSHGIWNVKITQTERFPHLTYFFNGGIETQSPSECSILLPTPRGEEIEATPESQSFKIADKVLRSLESSTNGSVFIVNFPAAGLASETGRLDKTVEAIQFVDTCLGEVVDKVIASGGTALITSSYGRCEQMGVTEDGHPDIHNSINPVPFILAGSTVEGVRLRDEGTLADVAPTILSLLQIEQPPEMSGRDLRSM